MRPSSDILDLGCEIGRLAYECASYLDVATTTSVAPTSIVPSTEPPATVLALVVTPDPNSIPRTGSSSTGMLVFAGGALILAGLVTLRLGREQTGH